MKKLILFGVKRHAIAINDYYMFFSRTDHEIIRIFFPSEQVDNRDWWDTGRRMDRARDSIVDPINKDLRVVREWDDFEKVMDEFNSLEWDYCLFGNGNSTEQKRLIERFGREKFLFSEYGWLPWSAHFYISREGTGFDSEIAKFGAEQLKEIPILHDQIEEFKLTLDHGNPCYFKNFVYVPMQKDVNDFKFNFTRFKSNLEFLQSIDHYIPKDITVLVKRHPLYPVKYDLSFSDRMVDITHWNINKHEIYQKMSAMVCINSTSILEALAYGRNVFAYGQDLFLNKGIVEFDVSSIEEFSEKLSREPDVDQCYRFISLLLQRQVNRAKCVENNREYIDNHYWNKII